MATTANRKPVQNSSTATGEKPSFLLFGGLALIGLLKDTLDLIGIGSVPVLGTGITLCFSFFSFMLLLLFDRSGSRGNKRMAQGMVVTFGTLIEGIGFVINFLPLQTLTAVFLYIISYRAWKSSQQSAAAATKGQRKKLQTQQARMARAIALREERMNRQVAAAENVAAANSVDRNQGRGVETSRPVRTTETSVRPVTVTPRVDAGRTSPQSRSEAGMPVRAAAVPDAYSFQGSETTRPQASSFAARSQVASLQKPTAPQARLAASDSRKEIAGLMAAPVGNRQKTFARADSRHIDASARISEAASRLSQPNRPRKS